MHSDICDMGARWIRTKSPNKFPVVMVEIRSYCPEQPDIIGFNGMDSVMIEVKKSRSDFKKDASKFWRMNPDQAVGDFRFYLCPSNMIQIEELPEKWGLLWIDEKGRISIQKNVFERLEGEYPNKFKKSHEFERSIMYSGLRRIYCKQNLRGFN